MKVISSKMHGVLDYLVAAILIIMPWALDFTASDAATWVMVAAGIATIIYSLLTNYEYSIARIISMQNHLILDSTSAIFLIASPWILGFHDIVFLPHMVIGAVELIAVSLTKVGTLNKPVKTQFQ